MRRATILLAEDHPMICEAVQGLLEPEFQVIGRAGDGLAMLRMAVDLKPDLVLIDVGMPVLNGLAAGRELKKLMPQVKLIFLSMNHDPDIKNEALRIGASGYILKNVMSEELLGMVQNAIRESE
jgi:DNA-binding NarL/FixJ family response regulator